MCAQGKEFFYIPLPSIHTLAVSECHRDGLSSKHRTMLQQHHPAVLTAVFLDPLRRGKERGEHPIFSPMGEQMSSPNVNQNTRTCDSPAVVLPCINAQMNPSSSPPDQLVDW